MIWKVRKDGKESYLAGTAHFFPYSFKKSLIRYIGDVDTVLIEGSLDETTMESVVRAGTNVEGGPSLSGLVSRELIGKLSREIASPFRGRSTFFSYYRRDLERDAYHSLESAIDGLRPWMAFFSIWYRYLRQRGWEYSTDRDAVSLARRMDREVSYLETVEEQIAALNEIPPRRIVDFLKQIDHWKDYAQRYVQLYLKGDLENMMVYARIFPTFCDPIIGKRDPILYERMKPFLRKGSVLACVGTTHIRGIQKMLSGAGYSLVQLR